MRAQAAGGKPLVLLEGYGGFVLGSWVILKIEETKSELMGDGRLRVITFSMTLKEYGEDRGAPAVWALPWLRFQHWRGWYEIPQQGG